MTPRNKNRRSGRYLRLLMYMTYADLRAESERTYVGFLWWILEPLVSLLVYFVVFGLVLTRDIDNYVAFLFVGLVPWRWLHSASMHGSASILSAKGLMRQVYLPKVVFPIVALLTDSFKFSIVFLLVLAFVLIAGFPISSAYLALPLVVIAQGLLIAAVAFCSSAVVPFFPDLRIVQENLIRLWFFLSGIFYDVGNFSEPVQAYFRLNPMVPILEAYRNILLHGAWPDLRWLGLVGAVASILCLVGAKMIQANDFRYPKLAF